MRRCTRITQIRRDEVYGKGIWKRGRLGGIKEAAQ